MRYRATAPIFVGWARAFNPGDDVPATWLDANPEARDLVEQVDEPQPEPVDPGPQPVQVPVSPPAAVREQPARDLSKEA